MQELMTLIQSKLDDKKTVFVFPSEIAANFWQKCILKSGKRKLIRLNQLISYDTFKKKCFIYSHRGQPVTQPERLLFLTDFFNHNRETPFLKTIIPRHYAANTGIYIKKYLSILPTLYKLDLPDLQTAASPLSAEKLEDLHQLKADYENFLQTNGLYDPHYLTPEIDTGDFHYYLIFPELQQDYYPLQAQLEAHSRLQLLLIPRSPGGVQARMNVFENSLHEIEALFAALGTLLDSGVNPDSIVITAANLNELEAYLQSQATIHEIPLYIHAARPLSGYQATSLLQNLRDCYANNFTFSSLKQLLMNQTLPWKKRQRNRRLLQFGVKYKCLGGKDRKVDPWLKNLNKAAAGSAPPPHLEELTTFYTTLKQQISAICSARSFTRLTQAMERFLGQFFARIIRTEEIYRPLQYALELLTQLETTSARLHSGETVRPFPIWLQSLDLQSYTQETHTHKIPVYPYRVSAGTYPEHHFILNTSQKGTKHLLNNYPFFNLSEQQQLSRREHDLSEAYLNLYSISGRQVTFSFARRSFRDTNIIPGHFLAGGEIRTYQPPAHPDYPAYRYETDYWTCAQPTIPLRIYRTQQLGLERAALTCATPPASNYTRDLITAPPQITLLAERLKKNEAIHISPSSLEKYTNCPFDFLLGKGLGLKEVDYEPGMMDRRELGTLIHRIFQRFYKAAAEQQALPITAAREPVYRELLTDSCRRIFESAENQEPVPVLPCWNAVKSSTESKAMAFIGVEVHDFENFTTLATEEKLTTPLADHAIVLEGKLDRISRDVGSLAIIDYKRNQTPRWREIFSDQPVSFQMPFYIYLMEENNPEKVTIAAYYAIEKEKYEYILHPTRKAMAPREEMDLVIGRMKEKIIQVVKRILAGDYRPPESPTADTCRYCLYRTICRKRYLTG